MKFAVLASGSSGNCTCVESGGTCVLIDAGTNCKIVRERLRAVGAELDSVRAVLLTHDHFDHVSALSVLLRRHPVPVYSTEGTAEAVCASLHGDEGADWQWNCFAAGSTFDVGPFSVEAFPVPHDAADPVGFVLSDGTARLGVATDLGDVPAVVVHHLAGCDALSLEFNHDRTMLETSGRPWSLIQRIRGRSGHLSNDQAAELLARIATPRLRRLVLAHLSAECNSADLAVVAARDALRAAGAPCDALAEPTFPTPFFDLDPS